MLFLPTEGLYAEVLRRPGLFEACSASSASILVGPTTLLALLNSLQMGFRTLAIEKRSSEVWQVLGTVKAEFGKFAGVLEKTRDQLDTVRNSIDKAGVRTRADREAAARGGVAAGPGAARCWATRWTAMRMTRRVTVVCSQNRLRSPTAEHVFANWDG